MSGCDNVWLDGRRWEWRLVFECRGATMYGRTDQRGEEVHHPLARQPQHVSQLTGGAGTIHAAAAAAAAGTAAVAAELEDVDPACVDQW